MIVRGRILAVALAMLLAGPATALAQAAGGKVYRLGQLAQTEASVELTMRDTLPHLEELGFARGRNLALDFRYGPPERLAALARELVATNPDAIIAIGSDALAAAGAATQSVPIVFYGPDPLSLGVAKSLGRPGGNVTGVVILATELDGKRLQLLNEAVPTARRVAVLHRAGATHREMSDRTLRAVSANMGLELLEFEGSGPGDYPAAFAAMRQAGAEALVISADPTLFRDRAALATLALDARLPTVCQWAAMAHAGCLIGYGPNQTVTRQRLARYVARIFQGTAPGELPIEQPTTFELVLNLRTAKELGIAIPHSLLTLADEVIE